MRALILAALLALSSAAQAQFATGNKLLANLDSADPSERMTGMWFVAGIAEALDETVFCLPSGATVSQAADLVRIHLRTRPADRHQGATAHVIAALIVAWPCQQKPSSNKNL